MLITDAAVKETAAIIAENLGGNWILDLEAPADGAAHLLHPDGRGISFRPTFGGTIVQLWITGNAAPALPAGATPTERASHEAHLAARLPEGHHYNKSTTLITEDDEDPADIILRTFEDYLRPAFECKPCYVGHQPWIALFDNALADVTAEREEPPTPDTEPTSGVGAEVTEAEGSGPQKQQAPEDTPNAESDDGSAASAEPAHADAENDTGGKTAPEPSPAGARRSRKRKPKRRAAAAEPTP